VLPALLFNNADPALEVEGSWEVNSWNGGFLMSFAIFLSLAQCHSQHVPKGSYFLYILRNR